MTTLLSSATPSNATLNQLYVNLVSSGIQSSLYEFMLDPGNEQKYNVFKNNIPLWINSTSTKNSIGVSETGNMKGLRLVALLPDGTTIYDSNSSLNEFENINVPSPTFFQNGSYLINENHGNRTHVIASSLSRSGKAFTTKYSKSVGIKQNYLSVRQGDEVDQHGFIIITMNS
jgi:hypothetical protein